MAEEKKVVVAQAKADCEELLVEIVQDKRVADEQEKQVHARSAAAALCVWHTHPASRVSPHTASSPCIHV